MFLALDNPRHAEYDSEAKAIEYLCKKESIVALARDIVKNGLNPLDRIGLVPIEQKAARGTARNYRVEEGNRRVCALKLLLDPELAPAELRKTFEKLSQDWSPIKTVNAVVFQNSDEVRIWLDRIHAGEMNGIGRRRWDAEQKARFDGDNKNKFAQALLDYAESAGMLTAEQRHGKITTVQRFLNNDTFRETLGIQASPDELLRTRPKPDFDIMLRRYIADLTSEKPVSERAVSSRMNKTEIIEYARPLSDLGGVTATRISAEPLAVENSQKKERKAKDPKPRRPQKRTHVAFDNDIYKALQGYGNYKLEKLYHSICTIDLDDHTLLISVGAWSFFETLTACAGRSNTISFDAFLSKGKLSQLGISDTKSPLAALRRINEHGNSTKHHHLAASFNGEQLINDMEVLREVILACIAEAVKGAT
ncbi:hypothetical protein GXW71_21545 [Roseomonas hellenica]|uniref:DUF4145 domain-containing protein n=1 Tax=Plastoroseomonas hellenica TaxID=2687306 RepID=A0ABS5F308_9PROT|nr:hypothetical protein [Plastoroseomonas hellenica]MBR0666959.1 hypothetical protein [Plastoroseomonas hellenica]